LIEQLRGPIVVFGAGGFIGINLLKHLLGVRSDVYGVSQSPRGNWRMLETQIPQDNLLACDINDVTLLQPMLAELKPRTIFQLSAYGAYSRQREYRKIHRTNFNAVIDIIEMLRPAGFDAFVQAGSNSEYGLNAAGPDEESELIPNSHYAVSKVATHFALKYFGRVEQLPVVNLRLYSAYGPWEEPDRLIPQLLSKARAGAYPPLSGPNTSRDFIHVDDISRAFVQAALHAQKERGRAFNIGTGRKTTLQQLANLVRDQLGLENGPEFGTMAARAWDVEDWYGQPARAIARLDWKPQVDLEEGIRSTLKWQEEVGFDQAIWNWTRQ